MSRASASYIVDEGEPDMARLAVLGRTLAAGPESFLKRTGLRPGVRTRLTGQRTATSPPRAIGASSSIRSPLQKRPGSYQLAGRRCGSSPMCW
ncbi:MAG: hypothetical protein V7607_5348 [Solirubrobacteraceae bacterium]